MALMEHMTLFPCPRHRQDPHLQPIAEPAERRHALRRPLDLPLRLRLGADLFAGRASDLSAGGIGMRFVPQPDAALILDDALGSHARGALEVLLGDIRFVARVRIAHVQPAPDSVYVGLAIDDGGEAARLIRRLEACGV